MTLFVLIAICICLFAVYLALRPLMSADNVSTTMSGDNANLTFLRSRLSELEQQHVSGKLDDAEFIALKDELESNLALEMNSSALINQHRNSTEPSQQKNIARKTALILLISIPLLSAAIYWWVGNLQIVDQLASSQLEEPKYDIEEVTTMVRQIEIGLDANPDDLEGWQVLSQTYLGLGRYGDAERAYLQVLRLGGANAVVFAALADASALNAQGQLSGKPMEYVAQALALDPKQPQALWLAGLHAAQMGDNETAKRYWKILLPLLASMPSQQAELADIVAQMDSQALLSDSPQSQAPSTSESTSAADTQSEVAAADEIAVWVEIDADLKRQLPPQTLVFVIARAIDGPRAPLAVKRYSLATLPQQVILSDRDSMLADLRLSTFNEVEISARISLSGQPIASAGDYQASAVRLKKGDTQSVKLLINQKVR